MSKVKEKPIQTTFTESVEKPQKSVKKQEKSIAEKDSFVPMKPILMHQSGLYEKGESPKQEKIEKLGYKVEKDGSVKVSDNGNCFYESISVSLNIEGKKLGPSELRLETKNYLSKNIDKDSDLQRAVQVDIKDYNDDLKEKFEENVKSLTKAHNEGSISKEEYEQFTSPEKKEMEKKKIADVKDFIKRSGEDKFWATNSHVYSLSGALETPITVINKEKGFNQPFNPKKSKKEPILLIHEKGDHYKPKVL